MYMALVSWALESAEAADSKTIALPCSFSVGEHVRLSMSTSAKQPNLPAPILSSTDATVTVTEATSEGYVFAWVLGPTRFGPRPEALPPDQYEVIQSFERIDDNARVLVRTDRRAYPTSLVNLEEVRAARLSGISTLERVLKERGLLSGMTDAIAGNRSDANNDQALLAYWAGQFVPYHNLFCAQFAEGPAQSSTRRDEGGQQVTHTKAVTSVDRAAGAASVTMSNKRGAMEENVGADLRLESPWPVRVRSELHTAHTDLIVTYEVVDESGAGGAQEPRAPTPK